jgi:hypothetical protein
MGTLNFFLSVFAVLFISRVNEPEISNTAYVIPDENDSVITFEGIQNELSEDGKDTG